MRKYREQMFKKGDLVFAKTEGHLPYPAKITKIDNKKGYYHVSFINYRSTSVLEASALEEFEESTIERYQKQYENREEKEIRGVLRAIKVAQSMINKMPKGSKKRIQKNKKLVYPPIKYEEQAKRQQINEQISQLKPQSQRIKIQKEDSSCKSNKILPLLIPRRTRNKIKHKQSSQILKKPKLEYIQTISSKQISNKSQQAEVKQQKNSQIPHQLKAIDQLNQPFESHQKKHNSSHYSSLMDGLNNIQKTIQAEQDIQFSSIPQLTSNSQLNLHDFNQLSELDDYFSDDQSTLQNIELNKELDYDPRKVNCLYFTRNLKQGDVQGLLEIIGKKMSVSGENDVERKMRTLSKYLNMQLHRLRLLQKSVQRTENPLNMHKRQIFTSIMYDNQLSFVDFVEHGCLLLLFKFVFKYQQCTIKLKRCMMVQYFISRSNLNIFFVSDKWKKQVQYMAGEELAEIQKQVKRFKTRLVLP